MKLSELYGKEVIGTNGKRGFVLGVNIFDGQLKYLRCFDSDEREFQIDAKDILSLGKEIIFSDERQENQRSTPLSLGKSCYDLDGKYLGYLKEVEFKNNKIVRIKIAAKNYSADSVKIGDAIIVDRKKRLKDSVVMGGKVLFERGQEITESILEIAKDNGEYVQTTLKSL